MATFSACVTHYVRSLRSCNVDLLIVLDGMVERDKHHTKLERLKKELDEMHSYSHSASRDWSSTDGIKIVQPMTVLNTLIEALVSERVPLVRSIREADMDIASACNHFGCIAVRAPMRAP
jgi:hypothetical protein